MDSNNGHSKNTESAAHHQTPEVKHRRRKMKSRIKSDKIHEALDLLNEAAKDKQNELYEIVGNKYEHIKEALSDKADNGVELVNQAKKQIARTLRDEEEKIVEKAKEIDKKVHSNPWPFVGAVALGSLFMGIILGKK